MINIFKYSFQQKKAISFRKARHERFMSKVLQYNKPIKILDIGGTIRYWKSMNYQYYDNINITLLNLYHDDINLPGITKIIGSATELDSFNDNEFDIVFSNSVIEHLYNYDNQRIMANEVQRIAKRYYIQCPNRYFIIEPHFNLPYFQFYPYIIKYIIMKYSRLVKGRRHNLEEIRRAQNEIRLLSHSQLLELFPNGHIYKEKVLFLTKSFIANNLDIKNF